MCCNDETIGDAKERQRERRGHCSFCVLDLYFFSCFASADTCDALRIVESTTNPPSILLDQASLTLP